MDRVFELIKVVFVHLWPQAPSSVPSHGNIKRRFEEMRVEWNIVILHRTFNILLSFAEPEALTQYRSERARLERDVWANAIQRALEQDDRLHVMIQVIESGLEHASYDIFLDFYSSCAEDLDSGGLMHGISVHPPTGAQCT